MFRSYASGNRSGSAVHCESASTADSAIRQTRGTRGRIQISGRDHARYHGRSTGPSSVRASSAHPHPPRSSRDGPPRRRGAGDRPDEPDHRGDEGDRERHPRDHTQRVPADRVEHPAEEPGGREPPFVRRELEHPERRIVRLEEGDGDHQRRCPAPRAAWVTAARRRSPGGRRQATQTTRSTSGRNAVAFTSAPHVTIAIAQWVRPREHAPRARSRSRAPPAGRCGRCPRTGRG